MRTLVALLVVIAACKGKPATRHDEPAPAGRGDAAPSLDARATDAGGDASAATAARPEHTVWNLVDNRHTAHRAVDTELVLDGRTVGFARYTRFGPPQWHLAAQVGTERAALADKIASLEVPVIPEQKPPTQITARVHVEDNVALEIRINGAKPGKGGRVALEPGWQVVGVPVDATAMTPGENVIALQTIGKKQKAKLALAWLRVGATHPASDVDPLAAATFDASTDAIDLAEHASLTWYTTIPEGAHLVAEVAAPCLVEVGARAGDASFVGGLLAADQDRVDLSSMAGKTVRLSLMARDCPHARITHARVTVHGPAPTALPKADAPKIVVLWRVPRLRADPAFDELARAATVFRLFRWVDVDRAAFGKAIAATAKIQAVLMTEATTEAWLARLDKARDKPLFLFADTSAEPGPQLARAIAQLKSWGIWDQTMFIVADGAELAVHDAARYPNGTIVDEGAEATDLVPTILDALGLPTDTLPGASLAPLAQGIGRGWPRPTFASVDDIATMTIGRWSLRLDAGGVPMMADAQAGAGASSDVSGTRPIERRMLTDALGLFLPLRLQWKKSEWGAVSNLSPAGARALDEAAAP